MFGLGPRMGGTFEQLYRVYPVSFIDKMEAENGDKVILPQSALDRLASLHVEYPMLFRVENRASGRTVHCGVLEFTAQEGMVFMPWWMMGDLVAEEGSTVLFRNVSLPKCTYMKLQPQSMSFLDITNPKAVLEMALRQYTCMTLGETFVVNYNDQKYYIDVVDLRPGSAVSVVETDCSVDFAPPPGYQEQQRPQPAEEPEPEAMQEDEAAPAEDEPPAFRPFTGGAGRPDGRAVAPSPPPAAPSPARSDSPSGRSSTGAAGSSGAGAGGSANGRGRGKQGKHVFGNRLKAKWEAQKEQASAATPKPKEPEPEKPAFQAFSGTARKLK